MEASQKEFGSLNGRLNNANFVERAKPEAVEKARADAAFHAAEIDRLRAASPRSSSRHPPDRQRIIPAQRAHLAV